jgi:APA family basic amino acid/polyamine antiporter
VELRRSLNLFDAILLVIGNVVGAGIFSTSGLLAAELQQPWLFIGIWIIGGLITLCGALTYAEMAAMFPKAGGDYQYLKAAYGSWAGFLLGWVSFWIITPGSIAALSIALIGYLKGLVVIEGIVSEKLLAIGIIVLLSLINCRGVRLTGTVQDLLTLGNVIIILVFIIGGVFLMKGDFQHFNENFAGNPSLSNFFGPAMIAVIFTYSGWFVTAYIGSEVKKPERNLPLSLIIGTGIVTVLYTLINCIYIYALPLTALKGVINVAQITAESLFSKGFARIISLSIMLAIAASINASILAGARIYYAMAADRIFWRRLHTLHPSYNTPLISILSQMAVACLLVILGTFNQLLSYVVFVMLLTSIGTGIAHLTLRWRRPSLQRPYRTWGYPVVPILFICSYILIAIQILYDKPMTSIAGILIALSGLPIYLRQKKLLHRM